ncbi:MAG: hypothetical protein IMZ55_07415 [Acidobacteria bacterium]|nr:hypothetical protein [Acidobacteriota bacterium]
MPAIQGLTFGMKFGSELKGQFFDRKAVVDAVDKANRRNLSRLGAFVRTTAQRSIRPAPKGRKLKGGGRSTPKNQYSRPGEPPRSHVGLLRKFLFFSFDTVSRSVVIGPAKLSGVAGKNVPEVLEFGGLTESHWRRRRFYIEPRPYMRPALDAELDKAAQLWKDSVKA